jgi:hypothetical protein
MKGGVLMSDGVLAFIAGMGAVFVLVVIAWYVLLVIANWKIFTKAGEAGWKSIIPIYNGYILYKISWKPMYFFLNILLVVISVCLSGVTDSSIIAAVAWIVTVAMFAMNVILWYKLAKAFGHGIGFTIGLFLLNPIFMLILGLGSSQYVGNNN